MSKNVKIILTITISSIIILISFSVFIYYNVASSISKLKYQLGGNSPQSSLIENYKYDVYMKLENEPVLYKDITVTLYNNSEKDIYIPSGICSDSILHLYDLNDVKVKTKLIPEMACLTIGSPQKITSKSKTNLILNIKSYDANVLNNLDEYKIKLIYGDINKDNRSKLIDTNTIDVKFRFQ